MPEITSETFTPDNLIAGDQNIITDPITVISGQTIVRGALLGKITASGKYNLSLSAAGDGSEVPVAIAAEAVDASGGDKVSVAYLTGEFNEDQVTYGTGHTKASTKAALRSLGIFLKSAQSA